MKDKQKNLKIQKMKNLFLTDKRLSEVIDKLSNMKFTGGKNDK